MTTEVHDAMDDHELDVPPARPRTALFASLAIGAVLAVFIGVLATSGGGTQEVDSPLIGRPAPAVEGASLLDGEPFDLAAADGQFTVVNFFATWCTPCKVEHPELVAFSEQHAATGDARVVSIVFDDKEQNVVDYFREHGGEWPVLRDDQGLAPSWGVTAVPETYVVGPDGTVYVKLIGGVTAAGLNQILDRLTGPA